MAYEDQTVAELQDELRDRDLPVSGTKAELIDRLEEDDSNTEPDNDDDGQPAEGDPINPDDYPEQVADHGNIDVVATLAAHDTQGFAEVPGSHVHGQEAPADGINTVNVTRLDGTHTVPREEALGSSADYLESHPGATRIPPNELPAEYQDVTVATPGVPDDDES